MYKKLFLLLWPMMASAAVCAKSLDVTVDYYTSLESAVAQQTDDLESITELTVHGPLDYSAMDFWHSLTNLEVLDLGDAQAETFSGCYGLTKLRRVVLPPDTKTVDYQAFYFCVSLEDVTMPSALEELGWGVFGGCTSLKTLSLPSSFSTSGGSIFPGCTALTDVYCYSPDYSGTLLDDFNGENEELGQVTLHVHSTLVEHFRQKEDFEKVKVVGMDFNFTSLSVSQATTLTDISSYQGANVSFRMGNKTDMESYNTIYEMGSLTLDAPATPQWQIGRFTLPVSYYDYEMNYDLENFENSEEVYAIGTLLNRHTPMEAQQVEVSLGDSRDMTWMFFSVPFDVRVSDIRGGLGRWIIRRYDPALRAEVKSGWVDVGDDETLHAGEGYIFQRDYANLQENDDEERFGDYRILLPAAPTAAKQHIFASGDVVVPLKKSSAAMSHNADWNLVGNPYPCYYDIGAIKESVTIYIYDEDESYYRRYDTSSSQGIFLAPCQTFFVQGTDVGQLTFQADGRRAKATFGIPNTEDEENEMYDNLPIEVRQRLTAKPAVARAAAGEFAPDSPIDPGANYFNETTGEAYFDLIPQGRFMLVIRDMFGRDPQTGVKTVTITAPITESDFIFLFFTGAEKIDLGRSSGFQSIPDGTFFYNTKLRTLVLPACVTSIGDKAFGDNSMFLKGNLELLDIYATTPPAITEKVFDNIKDMQNLVVRVPKDAVGTYKAADVWKDLNIQPLEGGGEELQSVTLVVKAPDGKDLTAQCSILWHDADNNVLATGATLTAQPVGSTVIYSIGLPAGIANLYLPVPEGSYTVQSTGNVITIKLTATGVADLGSKQLLGSRGMIDVTFVTSDSEAPALFNSSDLLLSIYNKVSGQAVTDFVLQYPNVSFEQTQLTPGQTLWLEVSSRSGIFQGAQTEATVAEDGSFSAEVTVKEWGRANISCTLAEGVSDFMALVFDQNENFVTRFTGNGNVVRVKDLPDGTYSVVLVQHSQYLTAVASLPDLRKTVLREGTDYTLLPIQLVAGTIRMYEAAVPALDESRISHISAESYLTTNDPVLDISLSATLKAKVVFKEEYAGRVSNVQLIVDIPEGMQFVANSVIAAGGSYQLSGQRLIIPCQPGEQVRWCLSSDKSGQKTIAAMVQYIMDGQQYVQPIGSATIEIDGVFLDVAAMTNTPRINVRGNALGGSRVTIYDGRAIVAETTTKSDGSFSADITLNPALDGTRHRLYADIAAIGQPTFSTETSTVLYDTQASVLEKVSMLYQAQRITWNELTGSVTPMFFEVNPSLSPKATFTASFINPKPDCILDPYFEVTSTDGSHRTFDATWNEALQLYTAVGDYPDTQSLPASVQLIYTYADSTAYERQAIFDAEVSALVAAHNELVEGIEGTIEVNEVLVDEEDRIAFDFKIGDEGGYRLSAQLEDYDQVMGVQEAEERPIIRMVEEGDTVMVFFIVNNDYSTTLYFANPVKREAYSETIESPTSAASRPRRVSFGGLVGGAVSGIKNFFTPTPANLKTINEKINNVNGTMEQANEALEALNYIDEMQAQYDEFNNDLSNRINVCQYLLLARCPNGDLRVPSSMYGHFQSEIRRLDDQRKVFTKQMQGLILSYANALENAGYKEIAKELGKFLIKYCAKAGLAKGTTAMSGKLAATGMGSAEDFAGMITDGISSAIDMGVDWAADKITKRRIPTDYAGVRKFFESWAPKKYHEISMQVTNLRFSITASYEKCKEEEIDRPPVRWAKKRRLKPIVDPSGYVYEGVEDNRVEGVTATVYFKENETSAEQMWDAAEFGQQNPQVTDAAGLYMWNVPQGLWQVRFEKEGYQPTQTEWLPVPPPQLEINVPMTQKTAPAVAEAMAYADAVSIRFTQYMQLSTLADIRVSQSGAAVNGTLEVTEGEEGLARAVRFVPVSPFTAASVQLTIPATAANYAGTSMAEADTRTLSVQHTIEELMVQTDAVVALGGTGYVTVTAYPAVSVAGKPLTVSTSSPLVELVADEPVVFDNDGQCLVPLRGLLPGVASVTFAIGDLKTSADVEVKYRLVEQVERPVSTIASGAEVPAGTTLELYCATPGAVIWYTTDGSCPCDEGTRHRYTGPITQTEDVTLQVMAVCDGMMDSEVVSLAITIDGTGVTEVAGNGADDGEWVGLGGQRVLNGRLPSGVYIHVRRNAQGAVSSRKVLVK